jgi:uncharacterized protein YyaL (SSP411 family)
MRRLIALLLLLPVFAIAGFKPGLAAPQLTSAGHGGIQWEPWSDAAFERARKENRLVVLDLEAVWCHWCHVMDEKTYSNPAVIKLMNQHCVALKVDQDSRPDLSNRYEDYGWPATIIFNGKGAELAKRAGYIAPEEMVALLEKLSKHPVPEEAVSAKPVKYGHDAFLSAALLKELRSRFAAGYDTVRGGWGKAADGQKFLDWDTLEYCMARAKGGDKQCEKMARETLKAQLKLMDPVWGGVYQYSTHGDWDHPHFEKIMSMQAADMRIYSQAYMLWHDPVYLSTAQNINRFLKSFLLSPEGVFYTSQDADLVKGQHSADYFKLADAQRRAKGVPRVDKHMYARENGWAINGLCALYAASGNKQILDEAIKSAQWILTNRQLPGGGYRHDASDASGPYLGDTLAAGRAFVSLYAVTGDKKWLTYAEQAADFIGKHFQDSAGFATADLTHAGVRRPEPVLEENVMLARFANLLYRYDGKADYRKLAEHAMRYLATPDIANQRIYLVAGILLADQELAAEPAHITVVGRKDDPRASELFAAALSYPLSYKRTEWWDRRQGPLPNMDVEFPEMKEAAAFACANKRCSLPVFKPEGIAERVDRLTGRQ